MDFTVEGSPGSIRSRAQSLRTQGQLFFDTGDALASIDTEGWIGRASEEFREAHDLEPERWTKAGNGFLKAADALLVYADQLENAQTRAAEAAAEHERGNRETTAAEGRYASYMSQMRTYWAQGGTDPAEPYVDSGAAIRDGARDAMQGVRRDLDAAASTCAGQVRAGCADAPREPKWWESGLRFVGGIFQGAGEAIWGLVTLGDFNMIDMLWDAYQVASGDMTAEEWARKQQLSVEDAWDMAGAMYTAATTDPLEFGKNLGKSLLDWDTWADDPARAIGHLVPDAIAAVATAGAGAIATRGVKGGADVIDALGDLGKLDNLADLGKLDRFDELTGIRRLDDLPDNLRDLVDKPIGDLTPDEVRRLVEARDAIRVEPGTPMQRVIPENLYEDYLRGSSDDPRFRPDQSFGFTSRAEDVDQLWTPREMHDKLGLDYELPDGTRPFSPDADSVKVLRYDADHPDQFEVPRHSSLGGDPKWDADAVDPDNPFSGTGYTSGGIPEFRNLEPSELRVGDQIWSLDKHGNQELVAVLTDYMGDKIWMPVQ